MNRETFVRSVLIAVLVAHPVQLWSQEAGKAGPATSPDPKTATVTMEGPMGKVTGILNADGTVTVQMPNGKTMTFPAPDPKTATVTMEGPMGKVTGTLNADGMVTVQMPDGKTMTFPAPDPKTATVTMEGPMEKFTGVLNADGTVTVQMPNGKTMTFPAPDPKTAMVTMEGPMEKFTGTLNADGSFTVQMPDGSKKTIQKKAEAEESQRHRGEITKDQCDGLREKIRTLQDLLRKRQEEPASPKQDLARETIRKQIDDLLSRLADCPKQEPINAQFDCLKSKFPDVRHSPNMTTTAFDPTGQRNFAWDEGKQAWIDTKTLESICPPSGIDPCLVGTWECTSFKEPNNKFITGGGSGFRVTFKSDGSEIVDYSNMQPIRAGDDKMVYEGKATAQISTKDGVAKIEKMIGAGVKFNASFMATRYGKAWTPKIAELGPGGLGTTKGKNNYKCTGDSLEYQSSRERGDADCTVKLTKMKPEGKK